MTREELNWPAAGAVFGAGILAKASLLVLAPVLVLLWIRRAPRRTLAALALGFALGGWWYARNLLLGLPLTGWQESVPAGALAASAAQLIRTGKWIGAAQTVAKSFTWFGAWSFLTLRTWMYLVLEGTAIAAMAAGVLRQRGKLLVPLVFTLCFAVAIAGGAAAYNAVHGIPGIPGWYLWPASGAMAILIAAAPGRLSALFAAMLALADLFGASARMLPYYAGLAPWNHGSITQFPQAVSRLHVAGWLVFAWAAATLAIPLLMIQGRE